MDKKTIFVKTEIGESEVSGQSDMLYGDTKRILHLIDDESTVAEITKRAPPSLRRTLDAMLQELVDGGYIRDIKAPVDEPKKSTLKMATPKVASPAFVKPQQVSSKDDLDFSFILPASDETKTEIKPNEDDARLTADAELKEAERLKADAAAKEAERLKAEAATKEAKLKAYEEAKIRAQKEVAAKREAEQAKLNAELEAAKVRNQIETENRARIEAESKLKQEAEAKRIKAEQEAEKLRKELEAAKIKAEKELKLRLEAEAKEKAELEARLKREAEAERLKLAQERAELEAARLKAENELKMRAQAEAKIRADLEAKLKREAEAERLKLEKERAELEAARVKAEAEAQRKEQELLRLKQAAAERDLSQRTQQKNSADKFRQSFVNDSASDEKEHDVDTGSFKLETFSLMDTGSHPASAGPQSNTDVSSGDQSLSDTGKNRVAPEVNLDILRKQEQEAALKKAQQDEEEAKIKAAQESQRLKEEYEAYRRKVEQDEKDQIAAEALADQQSKQWEDAQQRAAVLAQAEKERLALQAAEEAAAKLKPKVSRGPRKPFPIGKIFAGLFFVSLLAAFGLPYVWSPDQYIAPLETEMSSKIKQPVHIKKINFALLPLPKIILQSVTVGSKDELSVGEAEINFDFSAWFSSTKSIGTLNLRNITIASSSFDKSAVFLHSLGKIENYPIARMEFSGLNLGNSELKLPALNGIVDFDGQGNFKMAKFNNAANKLRIEMELQDGNLHAEFNVLDDSLPIFKNLKFKELSVNAKVSNGEVVFSDFFAHIFGGTLTGKGLLDWRDDWKLDAKINARHIDLTQMVPASVLSGELMGEMNISMRNTSLAKLDSNFVIDGSFEAKNGEIAKIDIESVARFGERVGVAGHTNFNELSGTFKADSNAQRFFVSNFTTSAASSSGLIDLNEKQELSGKLKVEVKGPRSAGISLRLSGTVSDPVLQSGH